MLSANTFSNDALKVHTVEEGGTAVSLGGITSMTSALNTQLITPQTGDIYDQVRSLLAQEPTVGFTTEAVSTALQLLTGLTGKCITSDGTHPGVVAYAERHDPCAASGRSTASDHMSVTVADGVLVPETFNSTADGNCTLTMTAHATSADGTTHPIVTAYDEDLPTDVVEGEMFALGTPVVAGTTLTQVTSVSVDFGNQFQKRRYAGSIFPRYIDPEKVAAIVRIETEDPEIVGAGAGKVNVEGVKVSVADTNLQFIARLDGGSFQPFANSVHLIAKVNGLAYAATPYQASGSGINSTTIEIATLYDDTQPTFKNPITWFYDEDLVTV